MTLIHQGKFRERANRSRYYSQSENKQAHLPTQGQYKKTPTTSHSLSSKPSPTTEQTS